MPRANKRPRARRSPATSPTRQSHRHPAGLSRPRHRQFTEALIAAARHGELHLGVQGHTPGKSSHASLAPLFFGRSMLGERLGKASTTEEVATALAAWLPRT
jgi:hypothetical protein